MKKIVKYIFLLICFSLIFVLSSCSSFGNKHKVTFNYDTPSKENSVQLVKDGDKVVKPDDPTREGYTFIGWYIEDEEWSFIGYSVTEDIELKAKWSVNQYTLTLFYDTWDSREITQDYGTSIDVPTPVKTGYEFEGWSEDLPVTMPAENKTLTAKWKANEYIYSFDVNGGNKLDDSNMKVTYGEQYILPIPEKDGYVFIGWNTESGEFSSSYEPVRARVASDLTLTAQWVSVSDAFDYELLANNTIRINKIKIYRGGIFIPQKIDGKSVTVIGGNGSLFKYETESNRLNSVYIPDGVKEITGFVNLWYLSSIRIPNTIEKFDFYSFPVDAYITNLRYTAKEDVNGVTSYYLGNETNPFLILAKVTGQVDEYTVSEKAKYINPSAFYKAKINKVVINSNIESLMEYTFGSHPTIKEIIINSPVSEIPDRCFYGMKKLEKVTYPNTVTSLGTSAFRECETLKEITIPGTITKFGLYMFTQCESLEKVIIKSPIEKLNSWDFGFCKSLKEIYIPKSVKEIDWKAFYESESVTTIYFEGTQEEWNNITFKNAEEAHIDISKITILFNSKF